MGPIARTRPNYFTKFDDLIVVKFNIVVLGCYLIPRSFMYDEIKQ